MSSHRAQTLLTESRHGLHNISTDILTVTFGEPARKQTRDNTATRLLLDMLHEIVRLIVFARSCKVTDTKDTSRRRSHCQNINKKMTNTTAFGHMHNQLSNANAHQKSSKPANAWQYYDCFRPLANPSMHTLGEGIAPGSVARVRARCCGANARQGLARSRELGSYLHVTQGRLTQKMALRIYLSQHR